MNKNIQIIADTLTKLSKSQIGYKDWKQNKTLWTEIALEFADNLNFSNSGFTIQSFMIACHHNKQYWLQRKFWIGEDDIVDIVDKGMLE